MSTEKESDAQPKEQEKKIWMQSLEYLIGAIN
jgi:hypothetical protein